MGQLNVFDPAMEVHKGEVLTSSLEVARIFGKSHKNVLQSLDKLECSDEFNGLNFQPVNYTDSKGEKRPMVLMTKNGFTFLVMGFTGKKAALFKEQYIKKFDAMEQELRQRQINQANEEWRLQRASGKIARKDLTDTIQAFVEYASHQGSENAHRYYANITKMAYKCLAFINQQGKVPPNFRDLLDSKNLGFLQVAESVAEKAIQDGMEEELHYKDIYQLAKQRVDSYAGTVLPCVRRPQLIA